MKRNVNTFKLIKSPLRTCDSCGSTFPPRHNPFSKELINYLLLNPCNHVPSYGDVSWLKNHISTGKKELAAYGDEIDRMTKILEELKARRDELSWATTQLNEMVSPSIHALPVELMLKIFFIVCEDRPVSGRRHPAFKLSLVCSRWRKIIHSEQQLWTRIHFSELRFKARNGCLVYSEPHIQATRQSLIQFYLEKSGRLPLHIHLPLSDSFASVFQDLVKHAHRWKEVTMTCRKDYHDFPTSLPLIETMDIRGFEAMDDYPDKIFTPSLRTLTLSYPSRSSYPRLDTRSLVCLILDRGASYSHFYDIVRHSPMLSSLQLINFRFFGQSARASATVVPTRLTSVAILGAQYCDPFFPLFKTISVPYLENLTFSCSLYGSDSFSVQTTLAFGQLIKESSITSLTLKSIYFENILLLFDILASLSGTLTRLSILMCNFTDKKWDNFLDLMASSPGQYLPNLKELEFSYRPWSDRSESLLLRMVQSRKRSATSTGKLSVLRLRCKDQQLSNNIKRYLKKSLCGEVLRGPVYSPGNSANFGFTVKYFPIQVIVEYARKQVEYYTKEMDTVLEHNMYMRKLR
ncbi:hypothetical protein E1B28_011750 [Marasmius oreades]|uniref:F-box domain-containing protein n=1 Tax=Marasmius oreades TaxID=181124 RepID=A0A9P7RVE7_9AGAR|nr:uncharacterized protein E1B28_011750 [Marasmius oreades]KAG7090142.1 hypothetical protein E1B28_011750 [Marasmius oreades]